MNDDIAEALRLDEYSQVSFSQLVVLSGLSDEDVRELVDHGALTPVDPSASSWKFTSTAWFWRARLDACAATSSWTRTRSPCCWDSSRKSRRSNPSCTRCAQARGSHGGQERP